MKQTLSRRFLVTLFLFSLTGQIAWVVENMYFNVFLYQMFHASPSAISAMVSASAVAAAVTTVFMGALSDKIGKRKIFISLGYVLWGVSITSFLFLNEGTLSALFPAATSVAAIGVTLTVVLDCVMTFFGSTANDAAFNAYLTDATTEGNRGKAEGLNAMMPLLAILVVFGAFMSFDLEKAESWRSIFLAIGLFVTVLGVVGFFLIREPSITPSKEPYFKSIFHGFLPKTVRKNPTLYLTLLGFLVFNVSIQIFMPYLILYYDKALGMANYVLIMAPAILVAALVTFFWGRVYDKKGFFFSGSIALIALLIGYALLFFFRSTLPVFIGSLFMMSGYLAGMAVFGAHIRAHTPAGRAGLFQGVRIFSQVLLPGIIGPFIGKTLLADAETVLNSDGTRSFIPNASLFFGAAVAALFLIPFLFLLKKKKKNATVSLTTPYEKELRRGTLPWNEYPRPSLRRDKWFNLNGYWSLSVIRKEKEVHRGKILVPFPPESRLSELRFAVKPGDLLCYERRFTAPRSYEGQRVLLHFGAVDGTGEVFLNDQPVGAIPLPYLSTDFDITEHLKKGENRLRVVLCDKGDATLPYGKQKKKRGGMWYTPVSGIWQTVWMESVPQRFVEVVYCETKENRVTFTVTGGEAEKTLVLQKENEAVEYRFCGDRFSLTLPTVRPWSPEDPFLYRFTLLCGKDRVESYFAFRTTEVKKSGGQSVLCLNGAPYFFHGLLDQGYFPDGIFLPGSPRGFEEDVLRTKAMGFNLLRKHIKIEPELFYYYCDCYGVAVFQDMINAGPYHFFTDTALPTLGLKKGVRHKVKKESRDAFYAVAEGIQKQLKKHPCVLYYTIFNEGWGQFDGDGAYRRLKQNDPTRLYDTTSGWFRENESDVESHHVYFKPVRLPLQNERPCVLSEFGGYSLKLEKHSFNPHKTYGYRFFQKKDDFCRALEKLYLEEIVPEIERCGLCCTVLTQLSDVEDETNGLLSYDRKVEKADRAFLCTIAEKLQKAIYEKFPRSGLEK